MRIELSVATAALLVGCLRGGPIQSRTQWNIATVEVEPAPLDPERIERRFGLLVCADRALAEPGPDSLWLVAGDATDALRADAARGTLSATNRGRRIDAVLTLDSQDPTRLRVEPREPLAPDARITLVAGANLRSADGVPLTGAGLASRALVRSFRVAPARECAPLGRIVFPLTDHVARDATRIVVGFDRAVQFTVPRPVRVVDDGGRELDIAPRLGCFDDDRGARCIEIEPRERFDAATHYRITLDGVVDDSDRAPLLVTSEFTTSDALHEPAASVSEPLACDPNEMAIAPFCLHRDRGALVVRGQTHAPASLRVRFGEFEAQSIAGTLHEVRIEGAFTQPGGPLDIAPVALDGILWHPTQYADIEAPARRAPLRITEVYARPHAGSAQEFVEISNVAIDAFHAEGLRIATPSGSASIPAFDIPGRTRAIIVGAAFDPRGAPRVGDAAVAAGAQVIRLEGTLAGHGLTDRGTDVWIANEAGEAVSRAPTGHTTLAPRLGVSVVRADARMDEDDPASWTYDASDGSTPGAADRLR